MEENAVPEGAPDEQIVRQPVTDEALAAQQDEIGKNIGITKGGDPAIAPQAPEAQGFAEPSTGKKSGKKKRSISGADTISPAYTGAQSDRGPGGQEPLLGAGADDDAPLADRSQALNQPYEIRTRDNPQSRRVLVREQLDAIVLGVQAELRAMVTARATMTWEERQASMPMLAEVTKVLTQLQDQREAHRLIERYFEQIINNPSAAQHLPAMGAFKKVAGGMAAVTKAIKGDGREQANKGKSKAESLLDSLKTQAE